MSSSSRIFLSPPFVGEAERQAVAAAFDSGYIAPCGPQVDAFENRLGAVASDGERRLMVGVVSSGTAALDLLMEEFKVDERTTVFASDLTFIASISSAVRRRAKMVLIDSDETTGNLSIELLETALEKHASSRKANDKFMIVAVDLYGQCCDYDALELLAKRFDAVLLIDAAEAVGAKWRGRNAGSAGHAGVYSFNGNKIITTSGGGAVLSRDRGIVERACWRAQQSRERVAWYEHREIGYNYRMSNLLAALGTAQLARLDEILAKKEMIRKFYIEAFDGAACVFPRAADTVANNWLSVFLLADDVKRDEWIARLARENIESRPVWKPMHLQPVFADCEFERNVGGVVSEDLFNRGICMPSGAGLGMEDLERIVAALV